MKRLSLLLAGLALSGCVTGQAVYAPLPGTKMNQTKLMQARGFCTMQMHQRADLYAAQGNALGALPGMVDYAKVCMVSQGFIVTGFKHPNGKITQSPYGGGGTSGKFPPAPKVKAKVN